MLAGSGACSAAGCGLLGLGLRLGRRLGLLLGLGLRLGLGLGLRLGLLLGAAAAALAAAGRGGVAGRRSTASSAPTSTVSSSSTLISSSVPATGEGISVSTLSVETSSSGSSTATSSPTCLSQRVTVPSVTDSPSAGSVTDGARRRRPAAGRLRPAAALLGLGLLLRLRARSPARGSPLLGSALGLRRRRLVLGCLGVLAGWRPRPPASSPAPESPPPHSPSSPITRELGADLDGLVLVGLDLEQRAGDRGGDLGVDLVGGDLEQRLVDRDLRRRPA